MKNTKKVLSVALAGALAFGSMGSAFAMDAKLTEGIDNQDVVKAIEKLSAFDIVNGMEDGSYHAEGELTRAQFSKMLVEALGLGSAAQNSTQKPAFNDVDASSQWAWGYINVAQGQGLLSGYPDGTFKPSAKVSYAEALTMLVRSLGYKDEFLSGSWPGNYMAKAADVDVTDGVTVDGSAVNRGAAALLLSNTLDANIIEQETYGDDDNWKVSKTETLIEDKLDVEKYEDAQVVAIPRVEGSIDKDQIKISYKDDNNKEQEKTVDVDLEKVSIDNLLGEGLNVYYDTNDKEVVFVEKADKEFKTYYDVIDETETVDSDEFTVINADKALNVDEDVVYYIDNKSVKESEFKKQALKGNLFVKAVANEKGNIAIVDAQKWEKNGVVAVKSDADKLTYFDNDEDTREIKAKDYDKVVVMDNAGKIMKLEDIKADDVVYVNDKNLDGKDLELAADKDEVLQLVVVRNAVEGKGESWNNTEFEIDNTDYDVTKVTTVSVNENKDVDAYLSSSSKLNDITGEDAKVKALLDLAGDIRHITTDVKSSSDDLYGIVTGVDSRYSDVTIKVLNPEGKEVEYELDVDAADFTDKTGTYATVDLLAEGIVGKTAKNDMIKYTVDKDGKIDTLEVIQNVSDTGNPASGLAGNNEDITKSSIVVAGKTHIVSDDVVVFDYTAAYNTAGNIVDADDAEIIKWADLEDKNLGNTTEVVLAENEDGEVEAIFFVKNFNLADDDTLIGYVLDINTTDGDKYAEIMLSGSDKVKKYELNTELARDLKENSVIAFLETSSGEIKKATSAHVDSYQGKVVDLSGKTLKIETNHLQDDKDADGSIQTLRLDSDAVYYETDDVMSYSDLDEGDFVTVYADKGIVKSVKLFDMDSSDDVNRFEDETSTNKSAWDKVGDVDTTTPEDTIETKGAVTYASAVATDGTASFIVDNKTTYFTNTKTVLTDKDGKVLYVGNKAVTTPAADALIKGDKVEVTATEGNVATTIKRIATKAELEENDSLATELKNLSKAKSTAEALVGADYTPATWTVFETALTAALKMPETTSTEVKSKIDAIEDADNGLVCVGVAELTKAKSAVADAKAAKDTYTAESFTLFSADIITGEALPEKTNDEVVAKTKVLNAAVAKLVEKSDAVVAEEALKAATLAAQTVAWDTDAPTTQDAAIAQVKAEMVKAISDATIVVTWNGAVPAVTDTGVVAKDYGFDVAITGTDASTKTVTNLTVNVTFSAK